VQIRSAVPCRPVFFSWTPLNRLSSKPFNGFAHNDFDNASVNIQGPILGVAEKCAKITEYADGLVYRTNFVAPACEPPALA